jgi:hypothetical protein
LRKRDKECEAQKLFFLSLFDFATYLSLCWFCTFNEKNNTFVAKELNVEISQNSVNFMNIICFKIKNPPTLHSTSKIQPTTSPTFVFCVLTVALGVVHPHRVFYSHFIILLKSDPSCFHVWNIQISIVINKLYQVSNNNCFSWQ